MTEHRTVYSDSGKLYFKARAKPQDEPISLQRLRNAIPEHCFHPNWGRSFYYIFRDLFMAVSLAMIAWTFIPKIPYTLLRYAVWAAYGFFQGLTLTGLWVISHELGHGATFPSELANDTFGFLIHSWLLTPYFSWRSTHRKHHRFTANMDRDPDHVPVRYSDASQSAEQVKQSPTIFSQMDEYLEDAPLYVLSRLMVQQILGFPMYLTFLIASGPNSYQYRDSAITRHLPGWLQKCQFNPFSALYRDNETLLVLLSDLGIFVVAATLYNFAKTNGFDSMFLLYGQAYLWLNHWIVGITFLHHTHPEVPKYEDEAWTFVKGATATVDRDFGWIGRFFLHNIIDYHVVHHLFTHIPFYHTAEATEAIKPILGDAYHQDKSNYVASLWREFNKCQWLVSDDAPKSTDRALWFINSAGQPSTSTSTSHGATGLPRRLATWW